MLLYRGNETLKGATGAMSRAMDKSKTRPNYKRTTLDFSITQDDIDKGERGNIYRSPPKLALQRDGVWAMVTDQYTTFYRTETDRLTGEIWGHSLNSPRLRYWISKFNSGGAVLPSDFRIKYPPEFPSNG